MNSGAKVKRERGHRSTIYDVARMAGVSAGTVSHVINRTAPISQETKERVLDAIEKLDYRRNANARALRTSDPKIVGIAVQDISSEYYALCSAGILQRAQEEGYAVITTDGHYSPEALRSGVNALVERQVNGMIFVGGSRDTESYRSAEAAGVPIVFGDRFVEGFPCVEYNNYETMYKLVQALYRQGYRKFCYYGEALFFQQNLEDRFGGFRDGLRDIGVPDCDVDVLLSEDLGDSKMRKAYELFQENLESMGMRSDHGKRVVLTSNDLLAQGVISALIRGGIRVPEDVAVFGFDNISIAKYSVPSFSTIVQDPYALGIECFEMLLKRMRNPGEKLENVRLKQKLVLRESSMLDPEIAASGGLKLHSDD